MIILVGLLILRWVVALKPVACVDGLSVFVIMKEKLLFVRILLIIDTQRTRIAVQR